MEPEPRSPAVAGTFYAEDGSALARQIEACFLSDRGPGALPTRQRSRTRRLRAVVVPHAGYEYSGPIAALAYARIAAEAPPEAVVILGVDHYGLGRGPALSDRPWATPLGPVAVDHGLVERLRVPPIAVDEAAHAREHSIEVQLPFLDYVLPHPRFVALQVPFAPIEELRRVGEAVARAVEGRDVLLVASTDLSHYVPAPTADRLDHLALAAIEARDPVGLYRTVVEQEISMCGIAPTTALLFATAAQPLEVTLLRWGHSGEAAPMREVVGYAALALARPADAATAP
ncbi:MAG TPA: AmmeMemoRadiSam system protein B [Thermoplasmata archaeon]|nr:AmmeMemoRadiSam system protein B [Thermoplasmata archaeon]